MIQLKRAYEEPAAADGCRVLVDRMWPRGLNRQKAAIDLWLKGVAPTAELRQWFGHAPERWGEFRERYAAELAERPDAVETLRQKIAQGPVTLVFAAKDPLHNNAVALKEYMTGGDEAIANNNAFRPTLKA
jgi:uncharacterized protein YeaO (DUF488 family)